MKYCGDESMRNVLKWGIAVFFLIAIAVTISGCIDTTPHLATSDPEQAIQTWGDAVNARDYPKLYNLAPEAIKSQISLQDFTSIQQNNSFLRPGSSIAGFQVLNRTIINETTITVTGALIIDSPASGNTSSPSEIPVYIKFLEFYENGEWRIWTTHP
jgi:ABC-type Fe2+-enterobactin transport system substrate-binding protein